MLNQFDAFADRLAAIQPDPEPHVDTGNSRITGAWLDKTTDSSAGMVSVEAAARITLAEIERQFGELGVRPESMAPTIALLRLRAFAVKGGTDRGKTKIVACNQGQADE